MKTVRPVLEIKHVLSTRLTQSDYKTVMRYVNKLSKSGEQWVFYYRNTKSTLSSQLTREEYQYVIKQLNIIVRPYRKA